MSAFVFGKRSFFEDIDSAATSPTFASPPVYKKFRCSSATSPVRFCYSASISPVPFDQLKALFPDMETRLIENALEKYGDDLVSAIKSLQLGEIDMSVKMHQNQSKPPRIFVKGKPVLHF